MQSLLDPAILNGRSKNISLDPATGVVGGAKVDAAGERALRTMIGRFAAKDFKGTTQRCIPFPLLHHKRIPGCRHRTGAPVALYQQRISVDPIDADPRFA